MGVLEAPVVPTKPVPSTGGKLRRRRSRKALGQLTNLAKVLTNGNQFRAIPEALGKPATNPGSQSRGQPADGDPGKRWGSSPTWQSISMATSWTAILKRRSKVFNLGDSAPAENPLTAIREALWQLTDSRFLTYRRQTSHPGRLCSSPTLQVLNLNGNQLEGDPGKRWGSSHHPGSHLSVPAMAIPGSAGAPTNLGQLNLSMGNQLAAIPGSWGSSPTFWHLPPKPV